jgi:hypothetical protein
MQEMLGLQMSHSISLRLDALLAAYEAKGHPMKATLKPGLSEKEFCKRTQWFPGTIPPELFEMYSWHNGQRNEPWSETHPFWFRDMAFSSVELAESEYKSMMESYGIDSTLERDGVELSTCFPFAAFNGGWYVLPTEKQTLIPKLKLPVVCVFQGIEVYFLSIEKMLDTCIQWVNQPNYRLFGETEVEFEIWRNNNPGIFL